MRIVLFVVILVHGLIHLMGFAKAFKYADLSQLKQEISKPVGLVWLLCALAFLGAGVLFVSGWTSWWWVAAPAVVLSQAVIFLSWGDAKFGTLANLIVAVPILSPRRSRPRRRATPTGTSAAVREGGRPRQGDASRDRGGSGSSARSSPALPALRRSRGQAADPQLQSRVHGRLSQRPRQPLDAVSIGAAQRLRRARPRLPDEGVDVRPALWRACTCSGTAPPRCRSRWPRWCRWWTPRAPR